MSGADDKCVNCGKSRNAHMTFKSPCSYVAPPKTTAALVRYEIECSLGLILEAPCIRKVVATRGRSAKAVVIVYVADVDRKEFESAVEANARVIGYRADPEGKPKEERSYARA